MLAQHDQAVETVSLSSEDQAVLAGKLLQAMREHMYSNRMQVPPRRIKELAENEIALIVDFLDKGESQIINEHGMTLAREGLGQKSIVAMASAFRLGVWKIINQQPDFLPTMNLVEDYTNALLNGYMTAYEEEQRREQQRTHEAFVRTTTNS